MRQLAIEGAWVHEPKIFPDSRGSFHEWFKEPDLSEAVGHSLRLAQANCSVSSRGTLRGIHFADVPPSQAKYVKCVRGAILDVVVDIRVGSPTYRKWEAVRLDDVDHRSVYLSEGLGHALLALTDDATVVYLCSTGYAPSASTASTRSTRTWPSTGRMDVTPLLSDKDAAAPTLAEAEAQGLLPSYADCVAYAAKLRG